MILDKYLKKWYNIMYKIFMTNLATLKLYQIMCMSCFISKSALFELFYHKINFQNELKIPVSNQNQVLHWAWQRWWWFTKMKIICNIIFKYVCVDFECHSIKTMDTTKLGNLYLSYWSCSMSQEMKIDISLCVN